MKPIAPPPVFQRLASYSPDKSKDHSASGSSADSFSDFVHWSQVKHSLQGVPQNAAQYMNLNTVAHDLHAVHYYGEELLPVLLPNASMMGTLLAPCYAGLDIYNKTRKTYRDNAKLSRHERLKKTVITAGDVTMLHLIATLGLPLLLSKKIHHRVHHFLEHHPKAPGLLKIHPKLTTATVVLSAMLALSKPIHHLTERLLDWTYYPLVDKKRRKEAEKALKRSFENNQLLGSGSPFSFFH